MAERTAIRERTRTSLLRAAIAVLSADPSAPLSQVAERADVARSTVHRYFPDRRSLVAAVNTFASAAYEEAFTAARTVEGTGLEAFRRLSLELLERLDVLGWWMGAGMSATGDLDDDGAGAPDGEVDTRIARLVARGHEDGSLDPLLPPSWVEGVLWATLYATHHAATGTMTAFDQRAVALRTLLKAVAADAASV